MRLNTPLAVIDRQQPIGMQLNDVVFVMSVTDQLPVRRFTARPQTIHSFTSRI